MFQDDLDCLGQPSLTCCIVWKQLVLASFEDHVDVSSNQIIQNSVTQEEMQTRKTACLIKSYDWKIEIIYVF